MKDTPALSIQKGLQRMLDKVVAEVSKFLYSIYRCPQACSVIRSIGSRFMVGEDPAIQGWRPSDWHPVHILAFAENIQDFSSSGS